MSPHIVINNDYQAPAIHTKNFIEYEIRAMLETDVDIVAEIDQITWGDQSWSSKDFFRSLDDPFWTCWVLENTTNDHSIVGYGLQYILDDTSHIANLCICPSQCGRGLGGILLCHLIDYARENGASNVTLEVHTSNIRAYTLYAKHGFELIDYLERYYLDNSDAYRMQLIFHRM